MMTMAMMIEPAAAGFRSFAASAYYRGATAEIGTLSGNTRRMLRTAGFDLLWKISHISRAGSVFKRNVVVKSAIQASAGSDHSEENGKVQCHSLEEAAESGSDTCGEPARLTAEETCRTIVEVNSKATLMLTDMSNEEIIWPDMPYVTDEYGNVYLQVKNDDEILQQLTSENNFVQAIIGFDTEEMIGEMELLADFDAEFGIDDEEEEEEEDSDDEEDDDDYDEAVVTVLEDERDDEDEDEEDYDDGDWNESDTMDSHPMYFAKKLTQIASDDPIDWMKQPPTGLAMQGVLRPATLEEHTDIQRHISSQETEPASSDNGSVQAEDETSYYKLEAEKIQLISADGHQTLEGLIFSSHTTVEPEDYRKSKPDVIACSAGKIISRLKDGGEEVVEALISLCLRCKGIRVEEAEAISVDSLGFDIRVCSATQVQTLRFTFKSRAMSEDGAERQLNELLFPRSRVDIK